MALSGAEWPCVRAKIHQWACVRVTARSFRMEKAMSGMSTIQGLLRHTCMLRLPCAGQSLHIHYTTTFPACVPYLTIKLLHELFQLLIELNHAHSYLTLIWHKTSTLHYKVQARHWQTLSLIGGNDTRILIYCQFSVSAYFTIIRLKNFLLYDFKRQFKLNETLARCLLLPEYNRDNQNKSNR